MDASVGGQRKGIKGTISAPVFSISRHLLRISWVGPGGFSVSGVRNPGDEERDESESESESESVSRSDSVMPANMSTFGLTSAIFTSSVFSNLLLRKDKEEMRLSDMLSDKSDFAPCDRRLLSLWLLFRLTFHSLNHFKTHSDTFSSNNSQPTSSSMVEI